MGKISGKVVSHLALPKRLREGDAESTENTEESLTENTENTERNRERK
jgi:hypothetical protein